MTIQLLIFKLTVQSSYAQDEEDDATDTDFDTVQWWITPDGAWRMKTFAMDNDIHVHRIAAAISVKQAEENTRKHYGDIIGEQWLIELDDPSDPQEVDRKTQMLGGAATLEFAPSGQFALWNHDRRKYSAKTSPE